MLRKLSGIGSKEERKNRLRKLFGYPTIVEEAKVDSNREESSFKTVNEFHSENGESSENAIDDVIRVSYNKNEQSNIVNIEEIVSAAIKKTQGEGKKTIKRSQTFSNIYDSQSEKNINEIDIPKQDIEKIQRDSFLEHEGDEKFTKMINEDSKNGQGRRDFLDSILEQEREQKITSNITKQNKDFLERIHKKDNDYSNIR